MKAAVIACVVLSAACLITDWIIAVQTHHIAAAAIGTAIGALISTGLIIWLKRRSER